ncbi:hypothetical protein DE146DRAFT_645046 [Phaeosphaeria sp. MPI-PUGE-AT-0046c]|nr:hypothetical protein DE146DRAFT_645046 [Phaeosphaeria sp. MPI-PUGE-AT-0046c]
MSRLPPIIWCFVSRVILFRGLILVTQQINISLLPTKNVLSECSLAAYAFRCWGAPASLATNNSFASHHGEACHR